MIWKKKIDFGINNITVRDRKKRTFIMNAANMNANHKNVILIPDTPKTARKSYKKEKELEPLKFEWNAKRCKRMRKMLKRKKIRMNQKGFPIFNEDCPDWETFFNQFKHRLDALEKGDSGLTLQKLRNRWSDLKKTNNKGEPKEEWVKICKVCRHFNYNNIVAVAIN